MEKLDTQNVLDEAVEKGYEALAALGIDWKKDEFVIVQPLKDGNAITLTVAENDEGEREVKINISDTVVVLDTLDGTLDVFESAEEATA